ncbi:MAG: adenylyltransferase/cytidyltransferase family protein [Erysipelotrichaceae bacterium]|nr:adenylyltransferase/cytidyltransferase family protein [Erysipelotrichaceae bacterium]
MRTAVYCGSFAPVHLGHIGIVKETLKEKLADRVIIVASSDYWNKKVAIDLDTRLKCLKLYESEDIIIDDDIKDNEAPNTYTLFEQLKIKYPEDELCLMLGADNLPRFANWVNAQYLLDNYPFIVMNRDDYDTVDLLNKLYKKDYFILNCDNFDISSSYIREHLDDYCLIKDMIDEEVVEIIRTSIVQ